MLILDMNIFRSFLGFKLVYFVDIEDWILCYLCRGDIFVVCFESGVFLEMR